jgi:hypothetical protein
MMELWSNNMTDVSKTKIFFGFLEEFRGDALGVAAMFGLSLGVKS